MYPNDLAMLMGILINIVVFLVNVYVIYLFYARLRYIADELRKFRIAFEMDRDRASSKAEG